jgi:hypothetical protein
MLSRKNALAMAKRFRTCPPHYIKRDYGNKVLISEHMKTCSYCKENATDMENPWIELHDSLKMLFEPATNNQTGQPTAGEVRKIKLNKALRLETKYYNPPFILVLETLKKQRGSLLVAQIYHDITMAAPGDLIVEYPGMPDHVFFIETWNTYTLESSDLGPPILSIPAGTIEAVNALRADSSLVLTGFPLPVPMHENDLRLEFRRMEGDMAQAFSDKNFGMTAHPAEELNFSYKSAAEAMAAVKGVAPGVHWPTPADNVLEAFLLARIPDEMLPLAAADTIESGGFASLYMRHKGHIVSLSPLKFKVYGDMNSENLRTISGRVQGGTQELSGTDLICIYVTQLGSKVYPSRLVWSDASGDFYAEFSFETKKDRSGAISLTLFKEADGI